MYPFKQFLQTIKRLQILFPKRDLRILLLLIILTFLGLVFSSMPSEWLEVRILDVKTRIISSLFYTEPSKDILLLAIDKKTLDQASHSWPWPNHYWAEIINSLSANYNPEAIVIDVYFQDKKDTESDPLQPLANAIKTNQKIGLVGLFEEVILSSGVQLQLIPPIKELRNACAFWGLAQQKIDKDGKVRTFMLADQRINKKHLAWELQSFLKKPLPAFAELQLLRRVKGLIALRSPANGFPRVSLIDIIKKTVDPGILAGKTIVIGSTATILHDFHETSLGLLTGPDIICNTFQTIRDNQLQLYNPNYRLRLLYVLLALVLTLIIRADFIKRNDLIMCLSLICMPLLLIGYTFLPNVYPPVGLFYITFFGASILIYVLQRLVTLSEIRQSLHEAEICGRLQQQFFPAKNFIHKSGIVCAGKCVPFQNAGGDYYDFFELKNGKVFFFLGDVSGHGISASMITTAAKSIVARNALEDDLSLAQLFTELNKVLCTMTKKKMMITAVAGLIDFKENKMQMLSGGHLSPILSTEDGFKELVLSGGFPIGIVPRMRLAKIREFPIPEKGFLVLYSDGIIEGVNWKNEQLGFDRFNEIVGAMPADTDSDTVINNLFAELEEHVEGRPYEDDVTFLVVNFNRKIEQEEL